MRSYIIHMSSSTARRANAEQLLQDLPAAELVEAVDGRDPAQLAGMAVHSGDLHAPAYPFALRPPEIGVFLSHRRCWQKLVESGADFALIAEDDLAVSPDGLARALALVAAHGRPDMYIRLPVKDRERAGRVLARDAEMRLLLPRVIGLQCICQVVGRDAAARLLAATAAIDRPVDTLLQMHWVTGQPVHTILPNGNREVAAQIGGSTIQARPSGGRLSREIKRALYRAQLWLRPQR
ncbi:glycosyl transferase family 25 [Pseudooceanicola lipolyticus]|uniref:Glycosyl transferase family 25 n=1 Tax=Pseudooceanicola lipolyticus TaxID=2029104 RepID=A0A2M8IX36_9RHOB|nr:glycosyltransferase family 25 protein [Pseudooceanicola lipolyticus]PJE35103.1 glycosyl transferase family 25 [Pseudooceanicola lipolyticus]